MTLEVYIDGAVSPLLLHLLVKIIRDAVDAVSSAALSARQDYKRPPKLYCRPCFLPQGFAGNAHS